MLMMRSYIKDSKNKKAQYQQINSFEQVQQRMLRHPPLGPRN